MSGSRTRRFRAVAGALGLALIVSVVGAAQIVQADAGHATVAKKCKKKKRKKCRRTAPPSMPSPGATPTTPTTPTTPAPHTLTVAAPSNGSVTSSPAGIDCPGDCRQTYSSGQVVTLTPSPGLHYALDQWSGDCSGNGACQVTMDADRSVGAAFALEMHTLTVQVTSALVPSSDGGTVTSDIGGISCRETGGSCSAQYPYGTTVTLTEAPDPSPWTFVGWSGGCTGVQSTCMVTVTDSPIVFADFADT